MTGQEEFTALEQYIRSRSSKVKRSGNGIILNVSITMIIYQVPL